MATVTMTTPQPDAYGDNGGGNMNNSGYWEQQRRPQQPGRSVTPAMNNTRGGQSRSQAAPQPPPSQPYTQSSPIPVSGNTMRSPSPIGPGAGAAGYFPQSNPAMQQRFGSTTPVYQPNPADSIQNNNAQQSGPSSSGLIRLTLRKPMGIVFEPMYDVNNPSQQRGVRICDLPRTGAAALSRKLEVGDELLSINDKTMSRLTFDEIMDFIIEADPENVNLLFRRPRKEALLGKGGASPTHGNSQGSGEGTKVKWVDEKKESKKSKDDKKRKDPGSPKKSSRFSKQEDDTVISGDSSRVRRGRKDNRKRSGPQYSESFLDLLIDSICAPLGTDRTCAPPRENDDYSFDDDDDRTFNSADDSTYVTYESDPKKAAREAKKSKNKSHKYDSDYSEEDSNALSRTRNIKREKSPQDEMPPVNEQYDDTEDDDNTRDIEDTKDPPLLVPDPPIASTQPPAWAAPETVEKEVESNLPISELEYDDRIDHGADVSVMESLGGPSTLIENQRYNQAVAKGTAAASNGAVSHEMLRDFGHNFPPNLGMTREETIQEAPLKFYTFVVKGLLEDNEPEKVRLLDKLMAKYKGREEHLVQKLSVRYNSSNEGPGKTTPTIPEEEEGEQEKDFSAFVTDVKKGKESDVAAAAVESATMRMHEKHDDGFKTDAWPADFQNVKSSTTEPSDPGVTSADGTEDESYGSESEYSGESIDGTSPAVIAQVSELLNYVYGKTSVPGQIDRVSTIMRAYEGREAVLLELLETKALIKANAEKESAANLPSFLRNSLALKNQNSGATGEDDDGVTEAEEARTEISGAEVSEELRDTEGQSTMIRDDEISSLGLVDFGGEKEQNNTTPSTSSSNSKPESMSPVPENQLPARDDDYRAKQQPLAKKMTPELENVEDTPKKKKKGLFGGLFKKGKNKKDGNTSIDSPRGRGFRSPKKKGSSLLKDEGEI